MFYCSFCSLYFMCFDKVVLACDAYRFICFFLLLFQRELEQKVYIFERKVESYKELTQNLDSTVEYIKVRLIWHLFKRLDTRTSSRTTAHRCLCGFNTESGQGGGAEDPAGVQETPRCTICRRTASPIWTGSGGGAEDCCRAKTYWKHKAGHQWSQQAHRVCEERDGQRGPPTPAGKKRQVFTVEQQRSSKRSLPLIRIALILVSEFPGVEKKVSSLSHKHAIVYRQLNCLFLVSRRLRRQIRSHVAVSSRAQWTREDRGHSEDSLLNVGKHVGALRFKIWKSLQAHVKYCEWMINRD